MLCPACHAENDAAAEACFTCGRALYALTQGVLLNQRYEILSPLGSGGMGRVYKAHDRVLDEHVAIKVLRSELTREPEAARRFRSEIKLARKVSHRNVCRIHEYGEDGGLVFISMEYIDGKNVREFLSERSLSPEEALELSIQVAEGLQAVHEHGIVHRDFKASNIMIDRHGIVKLMDFGIAKQTAGGTTSLTGSGVVGTPEYMSPEQASGARVDLRSDLYSLGCVIYETFTGSPPFRGATPLETMRLHETEAPPIDGAPIPEPLRALLRQALAKDPARRFASATELSEALRRARAELGITGERRGLRLDSRPYAPPRPSPPTHTVAEVRASSRRIGRRRRAGIGLAGVAALAAGVLAARSWMPAEAPEVATASPPLRGTASPSLEAPPRAASASPIPHLEPAASSPAPVATPRRATPRPAPSALSASPQTPAASPTSRPPPPSPSAASAEQAPLGTLLLLIVPEAEVTIDGRSIGSVSNKELALVAGPHAVLILHPEYKPLARKVTVLPGVVTRVVVDLKEKGIRRQP